MADLLREGYINSLPQPFIGIKLGRETGWPVETICVETGLMHIDVCGKLDCCHISDFKIFVDASGIQHDPETFYVDWEDEE